MFDQLIHNAIIVDGTGSPGRPGAIGITDGMITQVFDGAVPDGTEATVMTDAEGRVLCPGFIDPHTHYDAQLMWDPQASPSNLHGVTTIIGDTFSPANEGLSGRRVAEIASERGIDPFDALLDIVLADDLRTVLWPGPTDDDDESWRLRAEAWEHPSVMIGGSDAGAHLDRMAGAPYTTQWIGDCIRGRRLTTMERAIQHLTDAPAQLFGLVGRGRIAEGYHADLVIFDPATIDAAQVTMVDDLPGGTGRLVADAVGVERVIVGGVDIVRGGVATGALPGRVLRSGTDTHTVLVG